MMEDICKDREDQSWMRISLFECESGADEYIWKNLVTVQQQASLQAPPLSDTDRSMNVCVFL